MSDQPIIHAYDCSTSLAVDRPMSDAEYAQWQADRAATAAVVVVPKPPPAADAVLGAIASLDPDTASVADVLNAVRAALVKSGATPV